MALSDLRRQYETSPARAAATAAANADIDRNIADAQARRRRWNNMGRNPGLELAARGAAGRYFNPNSAMPRAGDTSPQAEAARNARGIRTLGTSSGAEAAAYARANPSVGSGSGVFGRNDREAAMQRNRDFIRSGRASMFGPSPATTKGILRMRNAELKGQELANQREANHLMAGNDRYAQDTIRQGNSLLAKLRGQELNVTRENNRLQYRGDLAKNANNNQSRQFAAMMQAFKEGGFDEEQLKRIEGILNQWGGGGAEQGGITYRGGMAKYGADANTQPPAPSYRFQERPDGDLNDRDVQAYYAERNIGPKSWLTALRDSGGNTAPGPATEGTGQPAATPGDFTDPAIVQAPVGAPGAPQSRLPAPAPRSTPQQQAQPVRPPVEPGAGRPPEGTEADRLYQENRDRYEVQTEMRGQYERGLNMLRNNGKNPADYRPIVVRYPDGTEEVQMLSKKVNVARRDGWRELNDEELASLGLSRESVRTAAPKIPRRMLRELRRDRRA